MPCAEVGKRRLNWPVGPNSNGAPKASPTTDPTRAPMTRCLRCETATALRPYSGCIDAVPVAIGGPAPLAPWIGEARGVDTDEVLRVPHQLPPHRQHITACGAVTLAV